MNEAEGGFGKALRTKLALVANLAVVALIGWGFSREYLHNKELEAHVADLERVSRDLERQSLALVEERLKGTDADIERDARLKLGLKKPGEEVVVVRGASPIAQGDKKAAATEAEDVQPIDNARAWRDIFFGKR